MLELASEHMCVIPAKGSWGDRDASVDHGKNAAIVLKEWEQNMCICVCGGDQDWTQGLGNKTVWRSDQVRLVGYI